MLCLRLRGEVVDLRWPRNRGLTVEGPRDNTRWIKVRATNGSRPGRSLQLPPLDGWLYVEEAGLSFRLQTIGNDARVRLDIPPECEVVRRPRGGRRAS